MLDFLISDSPIEYTEALQKMEQYKEKILKKKANSLLWLLEHNDVYTAGRSAKGIDLLDKNIKVIEVDRGGKYTYHGPGQCIGYVIADLKKFNNGVLDIRKFINCLEQTIINTLLFFDIKSFADRDNVGIWVKNGNTNLKIASIGIKISQMITTHGFALNVNPDLEKFKKIVPCGISGYNICSMQYLGVDIKINEVKTILKYNFLNNFL